MMFRPVIAIVLAATLVAAGKERPSLLDTDPDVVYLEQTIKKPIELRVIKEAPIYSDKDGRRSLGTITVGQTVTLEAMTERAYRVSAKTGGHKIRGWVGPWAFASKDPDFVENLKKLYKRQLEVAELIKAKQVAIGMTLDEIGLSLGEPTKKTTRQTAQGLSGSYEFIEYEEIPHYNYIRDPITGVVHKQLSHVTREEKGKTVIEFENEVVTAIEETEDRGGASKVRIVVPPVIFGW